MIARMVWCAVVTIPAVLLSASVFAAPPPGEPKLELVLQTGHSGLVKSVEYSPDGMRIVTSGTDSSAIIWDAVTGDQLRTLTGHRGGVFSASFSPDGKRIVTASGDKTAVIWDAVTGKNLLTIKANEEQFGGVRSARFSPDGKRIVTASGDKTAVVWDAVTGKSIVTLKGHSEWLRTAEFSPDGKRVVTGSADKTVRVWDAETGKELLKLSGMSWVNSASFSPDGKRLITADTNESAVVWDAVSGEKLSSLRDAGKEYENLVVEACFHPDPAKAVTRSYEATIIWDLTTGKKLRVLRDDPPSDNIDGEARPGVSPDGKQIAVAGGGYVTIWNAESGRKLRVLGGSSNGVFLTTLIGEDWRLFGVGQEYPGGGGAGVIWDLIAGEKLATIGQTDPIFKANVRADKKWFVTPARNNLALIWDLETGKIVRALKGHTDGVGDAKFSPDGKRVITTSADKTAIIWDAESGDILRRLGGPNDTFHEVLLSPDGTKALTKGFRSVSVWDIATGKRLFTQPEVYPDMFSPDSASIIASWADKDQNYKSYTIFLDAESGKSLRSFPTPKGISSVKGFSQDGKRVYSAADQNGIVWNAATGEQLLVLKGHTANVSHLGHSPDGKWLVTASYDGTVIFWDAVTGEKLRTMEGHTSGVLAVNFSQDGKRLVTDSYDGTTRFWDTESGRELGALATLNNGRDWLAVTPDGYFDGSENGSRFVSLRVPATNDLVPLDRYRKQFERPGLLAKIWAGKDYRGSNGINRDPPPTVRITSPAAASESKDGKLTIEAEAVSQGEYPVERFSLLLNGRPLPGKSGGREVAEPKPGKATAKWEIEVDPGRHLIEVIAHTKAVFGKSSGVEVKYVGGNAGGVELPTLYILAVGVSKYPVQPLDFAHRDAQEIAKAFQANSKTLFKKIEVKVLTDEAATRDGILGGLEWLRTSMTQKDFGVFFFAGHGVKDSRDTVYFLPVDGDREKLTRTAIDGDVVTKELTSTVGQLLVILDACHAGAVGGNKARGLSDNLLKDLSSEEKGIAIMCSASCREEAGESREHQHGKFTVALLEGLKGVGDGKDAKIGLSDGAVYFKKLDSYVTDRVKVLSKGEQHPVTCIPRNFRDFPLTKP